MRRCFFFSPSFTGLRDPTGHPWIRSFKLLVAVLCLSCLLGCLPLLEWLLARPSHPKHRRLWCARWAGARAASIAVWNRRYPVCSCSHVLRALRLCHGSLTSLMFCPLRRFRRLFALGSVTLPRCSSHPLPPCGIAGYPPASACTGFGPCASARFAPARLRAATLPSS